eukprot:GHVN01036237.1.p1 GENE.GHVN01036237.1~~GHVN01036237.1.p1  ORF type:complete len:778 (-),score=271.10 GHVN01036237.1:2155-4488(-)
MLGSSSRRRHSAYDRHAFTPSPRLPTPSITPVNTDGTGPSGSTLPRISPRPPERSPRINSARRHSFYDNAPLTPTTSLTPPTSLSPATSLSPPVAGKGSSLTPPPRRPPQRSHPYSPRPEQDQGAYGLVDGDEGEGEESHFPLDPKGPYLTEQKPFVLLHCPQVVPIGPYSTNLNQSPQNTYKWQQKPQSPPPHDPSHSTHHFVWLWSLPPSAKSVASFRSLHHSQTDKTPWARSPHSIPGVCVKPLPRHLTHYTDSPWTPLTDITQPDPFNALLELYGMSPPQQAQLSLVKKHHDFSRYLKSQIDVSKHNTLNTITSLPPPPLTSPPQRDFDGGTVSEVDGKTISDWMTPTVLKLLRVRHTIRSSAASKIQRAWASHRLRNTLVILIRDRQTMKNREANEKLEREEREKEKEERERKGLEEEEANQRGDEPHLQPSLPSQLPPLPHYPNDPPPPYSPELLPRPPPTLKPPHPPRPKSPPHKRKPKHPRAKKWPPKGPPLRKPKLRKLLTFPHMCLTRLTDRHSASTGINVTLIPPAPVIPVPQPSHSQPHSPQPHPSQPYSPQPHPSQPHSPRPHPSQPHSPQPHPSQPHSPQPHPSRPHSSPSEKSDSIQIQPQPRLRRKRRHRQTKQPHSPHRPSHQPHSPHRPSHQPHSPHQPSHQPHSPPAFKRADQHVGRVTPSTKERPHSTTPPSHARPSQSRPSPHSRPHLTSSTSTTTQHDQSATSFTSSTSPTSSPFTSPLTSPRSPHLRDPRQHERGRRREIGVSSKRTLRALEVS